MSSKEQFNNPLQQPRFLQAKTMTQENQDIENYSYFKDEIAHSVDYIKEDLKNNVKEGGIETKTEHKIFILDSRAKHIDTRKQYIDTCILFWYLYFVFWYLYLLCSGIYIICSGIYILCSGIHMLCSGIYIVLRYLYIVYWYLCVMLCYICL